MKKTIFALIVPVFALNAAVYAQFSPVNMAHINAGSFMMGNDDGADFEKPAHTVLISPFYMGKYAVTQKEYQKIMGTNPSHFKGNNLPVEGVTWYDAIEYCNKRSRTEGLTEAYKIDKDKKDPNNTSDNDDIKWTVTLDITANGYRLPTEAEWEYAARGGNGSPGNYPFPGSNIASEVAWYGRNSAQKTHAVGKKKPNALMLFDMSGNVWEWCWDWYDEYTEDARFNPEGPDSGDSRVLRGGSWSYIGEVMRSTFRNGNVPNYKDSEIGFRVVRKMTDSVYSDARFFSNTAARIKRKGA